LAEEFVHVVVLVRLVICGEEIRSSHTNMSIAAHVR
jgi:hypothetical protein